MLQIPVYGGAARPLLENYTDTGFFGKDGLGDVEFDRKIVGNIDKSKIAPVAMIDLVKKYPGKFLIADFSEWSSKVQGFRWDKRTDTWIYD